jgi:hypothetical protein
MSTDYLEVWHYWYVYVKNGEILLWRHHVA